MSLSRQRQVAALGGYLEWQRFEGGKQVSLPKHLDLDVNGFPHARALVREMGENKATLVLALLAQLNEQHDTAAAHQPKEQHAKRSAPDEQGEIDW